MGSPAVTVGRPSDALMSAGPKIKVSARSLAVAMASMLVRPVAVSICTSMPIGFSRPTVSSIIRSRPATKATSVGRSTFGIMTQSRNWPALSTTSITSR